MTKLIAVSAFVLAALFALPASSLAAPPEGSVPLVVSPSPVSFATTTVGNQTPTTQIDLYNEGEEEAPIEKFSIEGADPGSFYFSGHNCGSLFQYQSCSLWIGFQPDSVGAKQATVHIVFKNGRAEETFEISGTAVAPQLTFSPSSHDFGIQRVNRGEGSTYFQVTNSGEAMTQIGSIGIGGADTSNFWTNGGDCWGGRQLQVGESCGIQVGFNPWDAVSYAAELQVQANGSTFAAALAGFGGRAQVEAAANPTDFGTVTVGAVGPVETILFTNHGNLPGNFFIGIVAGGDAGSFRLLDENCSLAPVPPAGTCVAHVRFAPQGAGPKLARLALFGDDDGGAMTLLGGEGVAAAVTLLPASHDFGAQVAGTRSAGHAFAVRNDGDAPLDLGSAAIVGADLDQFALAGDECGGETLAPGAECLLRVRFAPDSAGAKAAKLRVGSDGGVFTAALAGSGLESGASAADTAGQDHPSFAARLGDSHPWRHRAHRARFSRGDAVPSARGRAARKASIRARALAR